MAFVQAMMNTKDVMKKGVNGEDVYTEKGVESYLLTLFTMLVRDINSDYIQQHVETIFKNGTLEEQRDLFVMAFQTRDIRGGKGERNLFFQFLHSLYQFDKTVVIHLLPLVPEYGCWKDMWNIIKYVPELETNVLEVVKKIFLEDKEKQEKGQLKGLSLLAKWLPREQSQPELAKKIAKYIYDDIPSEKKRLITYRKEVSSLNKVLKTVEINMCNKSWSKIIPEVVPGRCMKIHKNAFLNKPVKSKDDETLRYPEDKDRNQCRKNFLEFIEELKSGKKMAHGANVILPHELVTITLSSRTSKEEHEINQGQWNSIREKTLELGGLGKSIAMCDFSGSMDGLPKLISLALGILISEVTHDSFKDHILTFDQSPTWHSFAGLSTLQEKVESIDGHLGVGLNTNFYKASMSIVQKMVEHRVPVGEEPENLIVLTDMGFDSASKSCTSYNLCDSDSDSDSDTDNSNKESVWKSQLQKIKEAFVHGGEQVWGKGKGWKVPRIVIWNLRAAFNDFHAKAKEEGVVQLSGWSPSLLKVLQTSGVQVRTPLEGLRSILDDVRYDPIRTIWNQLHP